MDLNLVDEMGGLDHSIKVACELGGGLDPATVVIAEYPEAPSFIEQIEEAFEEMVTIEGQVKRLLTEMGYGDLVTIAAGLLRNGNRMNADTIQAVMPFQIRVR